MTYLLQRPLEDYMDNLYSFGSTEIVPPLSKGISIDLIYCRKVIRCRRGSMMILPLLGKNPADTPQWNYVHFDSGEL